MAKRGTVALPGLYDVRLTQDVRIAVGEKRQDEKAPRPLDHFELVRWHSVGRQSGGGRSGSGFYKRDQEAMRLLAKQLGEQPGPSFKPRRVPIRVLANLERVPDPVHEGEYRWEVPGLVLWTRMARYGGSRRVCACDRFRLKTKEECQKSGTPYPPDPSTRGAWIGRAYARDFTGDTMREYKRLCDPATCQFAQDGTCAPQTVVTCMLDFMPRCGAVAKFVTRSWQSTQKIRGSLLHIGALSRGWLLMLDLWLVVTQETVSARGWQGPIVHVEYDGDVAALRQESLQKKRELVGLEEELKALDTGEDLTPLDDGEDAAAWQREFAPETQELSLDDVGIEETLQEFAAQAGWSNAKLTAELETCDGDQQAVIEILEAELGYLQDAEFEDAEAESEPCQYEDDTPPPDFEDGGQARMEVD
ncbi:MAG: hypothetical protein U9R79_05900 [Armatimonadota bacterium]|nr:hypothetical protein [Armatimonadota bacterium]